MATAYAAVGTPVDSESSTAVVFATELSAREHAVLSVVVTPSAWTWSLVEGDSGHEPTRRAAAYRVYRFARHDLRDDRKFYAGVSSINDAGLRAAAEWARRDFKNRPRSSGGTREAPQGSGRSTLPTVFAATFLPSIDYLGVGLLERSAPGTLARLHNLLDRAVAWASLVWGWVPQGLTVSFHVGTNAFALAESPGSGASTGVRKISFRADSFKFWKDPVILRSALHELTHHYREERWPRSRAAKRSMRSAIDHDSAFCKAFGEVLGHELSDRECTYQLEPPDPAAVAEHRNKYKARTEAVRARRAEAARSALARDVSKGTLVWTGSADLGRIQESKLTWAAWDQRGRPHVGASWWFVQGLREIAETVPVRDWHRLSVRGFPGRYSLSFLGLVQRAIDAGYVTGEDENVLAHKMLDAEDA